MGKICGGCKGVGRKKCKNCNKGMVRCEACKGHSKMRFHQEVNLDFSFNCSEQFFLKINSIFPNKLIEICFSIGIGQMEKL